MLSDQNTDRVFEFVRGPNVSEVFKSLERHRHRAGEVERGYFKRWWTVENRFRHRNLEKTDSVRAQEAIAPTFALRRKDGKPRRRNLHSLIGHSQTLQRVAVDRDRRGIACFA